MFEKPMPKTKLELRRDAAQATLDKYKDDAFSFESGKDCGKMAAFCLKQLGVPVRGMAKLGNYKTALGARAALKRAFGVDNLPALLDTMFERIPPAAALPADIIELNGTGPLGTLSISCGNGLALAYHEDFDGAVVGNVAEPLAAWRTLPL